MSFTFRLNDPRPLYRITQLRDNDFSILDALASRFRLEVTTLDILAYRFRSGVTTLHTSSLNLRVSQFHSEVMAL